MNQRRTFWTRAEIFRNCDSTEKNRWCWYFVISEKRSVWRFFAAIEQNQPSFWKSFIHVRGSFATVNTRQLIHNASDTNDKFNNIIIVQTHFNGNLERKILDGTWIWTHNLLTLVFLPGHYLPYRDLISLIDHYAFLVASSMEDLAEVIKTSTTVTVNITNACTCRRVGVQWLNLYPESIMPPKNQPF